MQKIHTKLTVKGKKSWITIILLAISLFCVIYYNKESILSLLQNKTISTSIDYIIADNNTNIPTHPSAPAFLKQPDQVNKDFQTLNIDKVEHNKIIMTYPNYLLNVTHLVMNFLQNKDYTEQIHQIDTIQLPPEITNILVDLNKYNRDYLFNQDVVKIRIFPKNSYWMEKFIKIEKKSNIIKDKERLRANIIEHLDYFIDYFYSTKLQQAFSE